MNPVTSYSNEWYEKLYVQGKNLEAADPRIWDYTKTDIADGEGQFVFKNVPLGSYYVTTAILWEAAVGFQGALVTQGGLVTKKITVNDGETLNVIVTK